MRVIKKQTLSYEPFHKSLPYLTKENDGGLRDYDYHGGEYFSEARNSTSKLQQALDFERTIASLKSPDLIVHQFEMLLKRMIRYKEINFFIQKDKSIIPYLKQVSDRTKLFIDRTFSVESLNKIFSACVPKLMNDSFINNIDESKSFYFILPVLEDNNDRKLCTILMPSNKNLDDQDEVDVIRLCLQISLSKIEFLSKQEELNKSLNEMQTYQTKLANDYKLSAIGELTSGIVEEILSPLQVILSTTEFIRNENALSDVDALDTINNQVKKVETAINNLVKFAGNNNSKFKVQPCGINELLREFYTVVSSSLKNDNYECILDLEEELPPVLSQPNAIHQLFTNIFTLLRKDKSQGGGIFIQTRFKEEKIIVRALTTDYIEELNSENAKTDQDVGLKIINNIMTMHEGKLFVDSNKAKGTMIILTFPIRRRIGR